MNEENLRLAVIGLGKMGLLHASLLNVIPDVKLVALCDKSALMSRLVKKVFSGNNILMFDDFRKLKSLDLDAVYVTTPISSHYPIVRGLLTDEITRNVFVEKTLSLNYAQSKSLSELAESVRGITMVGYMKRFSVVFGKARELVLQGDLGELLSFKAYAYSSDFLGVKEKGKSSASRGGALSDLGCHVINLAHWVFGDLAVKDVLSVEKDGFGSETSVTFKVQNPNGLDGVFAVSQSMEGYRMPEVGLSIEGSLAKLDVNEDRLIMTLADGEQRKWYRHNLDDGVPFSIGDPEYYRENAEYINALHEERKCELDFNCASVVDRVIDEVRERS